MEREIERRTYGSTGVVGKDGLLSLEQQALLDQIQSETADACMTSLEALQPGEAFPLVAMATGIGKGKIIHEVISRQRALKPDSKILVIAGTKLVLVHQAQETLKAYQENNGGGILLESEDLEQETEDTKDVEDTISDEEEFQGYSVGKYGDKGKDVQVATIQTIQSEKTKGTLNPREFDLVIVDEVHNIGTKKRLAAVKNFSKMVGFTATPYRHSGLMKAPAMYGFNIIKSLPLPEAQELGLLPSLYALQINTSEIIDLIPTTASGKIDYVALEKMLKKNLELRPFIVDRIAPIITSEGRKYKTVIATNFVWESYVLAQLLKAKGISVGLAINQYTAKNIHTEEIPAVDTIRRYKLPSDEPESIQVLISPYVTSEGFDAPCTEILVWASPTDSHLRYTQYTGRLARRAEGKACGIVVDCLYQTKQYGWSYNFGMWMKNNVTRLDNGILYLGPIQEISDISAVEEMRKFSDTIPFESMLLGNILEVQEGELALNYRDLTPLFVGKWVKVRPLVDAVKEEAKSMGNDEYNRLFVQRKRHNAIVEVCVDRDQFIQLAIKVGGILKEQEPQKRDPQENLLQVQESDFSLGYDNLTELFSGKKSRIMAGTAKVKEKVSKEYPEDYSRLFVRRATANWLGVEVCTDRDKFIQLMKDEGFSLRDRSVEYQQIKDEDFLLSLSPFIFKGNDRKVKRVISKIRGHLATTDRERYERLFTKRIGKNHKLVDVCTDRDVLIELVQAEGVTLKSNITELI